MAIILITGASGQLGQELKVSSKNYCGYEFIFTDIEELDITDAGKTKKFIQTNRPDWIINCAAYNHVDRAEAEQDIAMAVNGFAVRNIVKVIGDSECRFIHLSSDYVFDGMSNIPYNESSVTNPLTAYGRSKLAGEKFALEYYRSMIIRTSWLYSSYGNNFLKTIFKNGTEKETLKVVFDQTGTPTSAPDLAGTIMYIVSGVIRNQIAFNAGIYNYSNEGVCSWYDFATEIIRESGLNCRIEPILSKDYPTAAQRPSYSVLNKSKIKEDFGIVIPHWRVSLTNCIKLLIKE